MSKYRYKGPTSSNDYSVGGIGELLIMGLICMAIVAIGALVGIGFGIYWLIQHVRFV